jgi:tRNA(fMet)-specific endonuclease VapC
MHFLFDTNILLFYIRENNKASVIDSTYNPFGDGNTPILSVVSVGEIKSIALRNGWGKKKLDQLKELMSLFVITDINADDVLDMYAEIDAFSQNKLKHIWVLLPENGCVRK